MSMTEHDGGPVAYSSVDFAKVPATLRADIPAKLLHHVLGRTDGNSALSDERQHPVYLVDLPSKVLSMTLGVLKPLTSTRLHRHNYETLIYFIQGRGFSRVGDQEVQWAAGDALYVPVWAWHQHHSTEKAQEVLYVAAENAPQLLNLGIALREESPE
jgi:quercetin dioxygenase-like cupin family protein